MNDNRPIFFDNDCLASFLWIQRIDIVDTLFERRIRIPSEVIRELERLKFTPSGNRVYDELLKFVNGHAYVQVSMPVTSATFGVYQQLTHGCFGKIMGNGEAAVLAHAKHEKGIVASNNLKDVEDFCIKNGLDLISTEHILVAGVANKVISFAEAENAWSDMIQKKRLLPSYGFKGAWQRLAGELQVASSKEE